VSLVPKDALLTEHPSNSQAEAGGYFPELPDYDSGVSGHLERWLGANRFDSVDAVRGPRSAVRGPQSGPRAGDRPSVELRARIG
jgi:hypothetical protein